MAFRTPNRLCFVSNDEDQVIYLKDEELDFSYLLQQVQSLFERGVRIVSLETHEAKIFFDSSRGISGRFKTGYTVKS
jgi:hypothetical protein